MESECSRKKNKKSPAWDQNDQDPQEGAEEPSPSAIPAEAIAHKVLVNLAKHPTQISLSIADVNAQLCCGICEGYFRDAHTIRECLHTFCKSCILKRFDSGDGDCPSCGQDLGVHPLEGIEYDRSKQEIVNKLFPQFEKNDLIKETEFYESRGYKRRIDQNSTEKQLKALPLPHRIAQANLPVSQPSERNIRFVLIPSTFDSNNGPNSPALPPLLCPLLNTSGKVKVLQLKKYVSKKLDLADRSAVEIQCKKTTLGDELSLFYIYRTLWYGQEDDMVLNYHSSIDFEEMIQNVEDKEADLNPIH